MTFSLLIHCRVINFNCTRKNLPKNLAMKVRLSEIAKQANVSVSTVSRILSGDTSRRASAETVERVLEAARTLGWVDNRAESIRRTQKLLRIGIIFISDYESLAS